VTDGTLIDADAAVDSIIKRNPDSKETVTIKNTEQESVLKNRRSKTASGKQFTEVNTKITSTNCIDARQRAISKRKWVPAHVCRPRGQISYSCLGIHRRRCDRLQMHCGHRLRQFCDDF